MEQQDTKVFDTFLTLLLFDVFDTNATAHSDGARCLKVGEGGLGDTRKTGLTRGLSRAPYARVWRNPGALLSLKK